MAVIITNIATQLLAVFLMFMFVGGLVKPQATKFDKVLCTIGSLTALALIYFVGGTY